MNLKKKPTPGKCAAARCRKESDVIYSANGEELEFCAVHGADFSDLDLESRSSRPPTPTPAPARPTPARPTPAPEITKVEVSLVHLAPLQEPEALELVDSTTDEMVLTMEGAAFVTQLRQDAADHQETLAVIKSMTIQTQDDFASAEEALVEAKGLWKGYEERRTAFTKPANKILREFNGWFKPAQTALKAIEAALKGQLSGFRMHQIQEERRLLEVAREAEVPEEIHTAVIAAATAVPEAASVSFIDKWVFEVTNEGEIPREFLTPDLQKIGQVVAAMKDKATIPGVRVWNQPTVRSPSK